MAVGFEFQAPTLKIYKIDKKTETELCKLQQAKDWSGLKAAAEAAVASPRFFDKSVVLSKSATGWTAVPDGDDVEFVTTEIPIESGGATRVAQVMTSIELVINRIKKIFDGNARRTVCPWARSLWSRGRTAGPLTHPTANGCR